MKPSGAARLSCRGLRCRALTTAQAVLWQGRERPARSALKSEPSKPFGQKCMSPFPADLAASKELGRLRKEGAAERTAHCRTLYAPTPQERPTTRPCSTLNDSPSSSPPGSLTVFSVWAGRSRLPRTEGLRSRPHPGPGAFAQAAPRCGASRNCTYHRRRRHPPAFGRAAPRPAPFGRPRPSKACRPLRSSASCV